MRDQARPRFLQTSAVMKAAGVGRETLRFYERKGLLPKAQRSEAGYRQYAADTVELLLFIKDAQQAGFTLREIQVLTQLRARSLDTCANVSPVLQKKLVALEEEIEALKKKKSVLARLTRACARQTSTGAASCDVLPREGRASALRRQRR